MKNFKVSRKDFNWPIFIILTATLVVSGLFIFINKAQAETLNVVPIKLSIDDNTNFGSSDNEVIGFDVDLTLDELFAGEGLKYEYTVLEGGSYSGASPVSVVIDLADGRHIILFPGWGDRADTYTLQYSETVAHDTGGNNYVDFSLQPEDFSSWLYGSGSTYGDFEFVKSDTSLIDGTEVVTRVAIQHQAANTGQKDKIVYVLINSVTYYGLVQGAIDAASSGDVINVAAGTYNESLTIDKSLTLLGAQADVDPRPSQGGRTGDESIIDAQEGSSYVVRISASDVEINGFTITGGTGDMVEESGFNKDLLVQNLLFQYNILYDDLESSGDEAIQIKYSDEVIIQYNYAYNILQDAFNLSASYNGTVRHNEAHDIYSENAAIYCYDAEDIDIIGNLIYDVPNNDGIKLGDSGDGSTDGTVSDNIVHDVAEDGITIYASGITVDNNTIYNSGSENGALYLYGADDTTVTNNNIYNNDAIGLLIHNSNDVTVTRNVIYNNDDTDDTKYSDSAGIWLTSSATNIVINNNNSIYDNADYELKNENTLEEVDAEDNWWGTAVESEMQALISGNVDYNPWYVSEDMTSFRAIVTEVDGENEIELPEIEFTAEVEVENEIKTVTVSIPAETKVTGSSDWTGVINPPTVKETATVAPSKAGFTSTVSKVIEIGFSGEILTFDNAVKIVIPGETGKKVGYSYDGSTFTEITTVCGENNQTWANNNLLEGEDCYFDDTTDLIVWTKHFTEFIVYSFSLIPIPVWGATPGPEPKEEPSLLSEEAQKLDINTDDKIDILDFNTLMVNWGSTLSNNIADFDGDNKVDIFDFNLLMIHWTG